LYALKAVEKYTAAGRKIAFSTVINEQAALTELNGSDFILPLHACFHDTENFYLVTVRLHIPSSLHFAHRLDRSISLEAISNSFKD
jgi:hypothetical protein